MKFWIKILISVFVVIVAVFAVWAFCFREKDEVQAYNRTAELIDYKQSIGIRDKLIKLSTIDYISDNAESKIGNDTDVKKEIERLRKFCLSTEDISDYGNIVVCSYFEMDEYVNEVLEFYLSHLKSDKTKNKPLKALKNNIEDYIKSLKKLNEKIDDVLEYQKVIAGSDVEFKHLRDFYKYLYSQYRSTLNSASNVIISIENYIDICVYSDDLLVDTKFALNDSFARALANASTVDENLALDYAHDVYVVLNTIEKYDGGENIFISNYSEYDFLLSYNKLFNKYSDTLNNVFAEKKQQMAMADKNALSSVIQNAQDSVTISLKVLGF